MARGYQWLLSILLIGTAAALGSKLVTMDISSVEVATPDSGVEESTRQPDPTELASVTDTESHAIDEFAEVIARPLFFRSRRPQFSLSDGQDGLGETSSSTLPAGSAEKAQYMVMGIIIDNEVKMALLKPSAGKGDAIRVKEGEKLEGWTVSTITTDAVTLLQGDSKDVIKLSDNVLSGAEKRRLMQQAKLAKRRTASKQPKKAQRNKPNRRKITKRPARTTTRRKIPAKRVKPRTPKPRQAVRN